MNARKNLMTLGILSVAVVVFLTMQLIPGVFSNQEPGQSLIAQGCIVDH